MMAWGYWTCYTPVTAANGYSRGGQQGHAGQRAGGQQVLLGQQPQNNELYYHHAKQHNSQSASQNQPQRDRSLDRESRQLLISNSTGTGNSVSDASSGGQKLSNHHANTISDQENHVEPEKVAFERRLLLGDPDWGSRTIADRNTLPRKKQPEYDKNSVIDNNAIYGASTACTGGATSTSNSSRGRRSSSKMVSTPPDSVSRKSMEEEDDNFCPACAQHSNRESRVSFGSLASSSRGSSNNKHHPRTRSRSQDDDECDYSSDHGGDGGGVEHPPGGRLPPHGGGVHRGVSHDGHESVHGGGGGHHHGGGGRVPGGVGVHRGASHDGHDDRQNLSSSLPTPPPPPFCSQRDLIRHQASLLETINQKMAFLSAFKLPPAMTPNPMVQHQQAPPGKCDTLVEVHGHQKFKKIFCN